MDLSELRERVECSRPSEGEQAESAEVDLGPHCVLDADDIGHMKERAYREGRRAGYNDGFGNARTWARDETLRKVRDAETRGVLAGLLAAIETMDIAVRDRGDSDGDPAVKAYGDIGEMYEAISREGLHDERKPSTGPNFAIDFGQQKMWPMTDPAS